MGICSPFVEKSEPTGAERVARSQLDSYVLFLIHSVIIKCDIQCIYKRVITLLNDVYLTASYITCTHAHCDRACARTQLAIPHIQFWMIITATWIKLVQINFIIIPKYTTFHTGVYSVFLREDFQSNKDLSDEIIRQTPVWNIVQFAI